MRAYKWSGNKISKPGAYVGLPIDVYHGDPVSGRYVTASALGRASRSMAHFWAYCPWNPDREPPDVDTDALRLGRASHVLAFQPDLFESQFATCPYGDDYRVREARLWKETLSPDLLPLKPKELATILRMASALRKSEDARNLFRNGLPEMSFVAKDEATGLYMLSRPDFTPAHHQRGLVDYKTTVDGAWEAFGRSAFNYGYDLQGALALDVVAAATGELRPAYWIVAQEKEPPYCVSVHRMEADQILYGKRRVRDLLDRIAWAIEAGEWPGYGPAQSLVTPYYVQRQIEAAENAV